MQRDLQVFLQDILSAAAEIQSYISGKSHAEYLTEGLIRRAVERCLEIIGEALVNIQRHNASALDAIPNAPQLIGLRNILIHEYGSVDDGRIWEAITTKLQDVTTAVERELGRG